MRTPREGAERLPSLEEARPLREELLCRMKDTYHVFP